MNSYKFNEAADNIYKFFWNSYCDWYIELNKSTLPGELPEKHRVELALGIFEQLMKLLHPFMPFLTEEIWHFISKRTPEQALIVSKFPTQKPFDNSIILSFDFASQIISGIRKIRKEKNISFRNNVELFFVNNENYTSQFNEVIQKLTNTSKISEVEEKVEGASFRVNSNEYYIPVPIENIDLEAEIKKLEAELERAQGFLLGVQKKLSNERFIKNAPEKVIILERKKEIDTAAKIRTIETRLSSLH